MKHLHLWLRVEEVVDEPARSKEIKETCFFCGTVQERNARLGYSDTPKARIAWQDDGRKWVGAMLHVAGRIKDGTLKPYDVVSVARHAKELGVGLDTVGRGVRHLVRVGIMGQDARNAFIVADFPVNAARVDVTPGTDPLDERHFSVREIADMRRVDVSVIYRLIRGNKLDATRPGQKSIRVSESAYRAYFGEDVPGNP